jgi:hypothetical protein
MLQEVVVLQGACCDNDSTIARCKDATIKLLYAVNCGDYGNKRIFVHCIAKSDDVNHICCVVLQEVTTTMIDCDKGTQDHATQQPTIFLCCIAREQAMITNAQSARDEIHCNANNIVDM